MNKKNRRWIAGAALVSASLNAYAQDAASDTPSGVAAQAAVGAAASAPQAKAADRALRKRVLTALAKSQRLRASGITVRAHGGAVVLEGWVPEQSQIEEATRVARSVGGVTSVQNTLTLSTF